MAEIMTETLNPSFSMSKRAYKKQKDIREDISSMTPTKNSVNSSTVNSNDWHRLLLSRLKAGVTRKYRTKNKNGTVSEIISSTSFEDTNVAMRSYIDESQTSEKTDTNATQSDIVKPLDSSTESSVRRDNHYIKNSLSNRFHNNNTITSLKRRVRKQQMRCLQHQATIVQERTYELSSTANLLFVPYGQYIEPSYQNETEKYSSVVQLPPLKNSMRTLAHHLHDIQLNIYGY